MFLYNNSKLNSITFYVSWWAGAVSPQETLGIIALNSSKDVKNSYIKLHRRSCRRLWHCLHVEREEYIGELDCWEAVADLQVPPVRVYYNTSMELRDQMTTAVKVANLNNILEGVIGFERLPDPVPVLWPSLDLVTDEAPVQKRTETIILFVLCHDLMILLNNVSIVP